MTTPRVPGNAPDTDAWLRLVIEQIPAVLWTTDRELRFTTSVGAGLQALGLDPNQVVGMDLTEYLQTDDVTFPPLAAHMRALSGQRASIEVNLGGNDYELHVDPLRDENQKIIGTVGVALDITERKNAERVLSESEERFSKAFRSSPTAMLIVNYEDGRYIDTNDSFLRMCRYSREEVIGRTAIELGMWDNPTECEEMMRLVGEQGFLRNQKYRYRTKCGRLVTSRISIELIDVGATRCMLVAAEDVTQHEQAEADLQAAKRELERRVDERTRSLQESEGKWKSFANTAVDYITILDLNGTIQYINRTSADYTVEEVVGRSSYDFALSEYHDEMRRCFECVLATGEIATFESANYDLAGELKWHSSRVGPLKQDDEMVGLTLFVTDVTDRKVVEEKLRADERLLRRLLDLHERERQLISYEIHDGLVQDVVAAKMMIEAACEKLVGDNQAAHEMDLARRSLTKAIDEGRRLISELRPLIIDEQGIEAAIRYLIAESQQQSGLRVDFSSDLRDERFSQLLEGAMFRIVQEALTNVRRHSQADEAQVRLSQTNGQILLEISDSGVGFDPQAVPEDRFGVRGIVERARLFGGKATIESSPGKGTQIRVTLAVEPPSTS